MKKFSIVILLLIFLFSLQAQEQQKEYSLDLGGALRFNHNFSSWKPNQMRRGGDFGFEMFRIDVHATYKKWEFLAEQRIYSEEFGGAFLKYGYFQYNISEEQKLRFGLIPAYFGAQQFNSHSWFFQLPFYLGFEDDHDMGVSYDLNTDRHQLDIAFYKNAEEYSFSDNAPISDSRYNYDFSGDNKEVNQLTLRYNYKFEKDGNHLLGASIQYGGIWNIPSESMGDHYGIGLHYDGTLGQWNLKTQLLTYNNRAVGNPSAIEMTAYGFPYQTAARASIFSIGLAYTWEVDYGPINSIQFYNDYAYMDKAIENWEDTQMNVTGALINAHPAYFYIDMARGLHHPWLGPQWENALTTGDENNSWEYRFNVNFGFYF